MGWVVNATPQQLYPRERLGTHYIGGWVGPRAGLDGSGKSLPHCDSIPRTLQPVASRYADWAISARRILKLSLIYPVHSLPSFFFKAYFNIILYPCLRLPGGLFPSGVSTKTVYALLCSNKRATWPVPVARVIPCCASRAFVACAT